jgi:hypothetical protein
MWELGAASGECIRQVLDVLGDGVVRELQLGEVVSPDGHDALHAGVVRRGPDKELGSDLCRILGDTVGAINVRAIGPTGSSAAEATVQQDLAERLRLDGRDGDGVMMAH